jgi:hypothetical protein
MDFHDYETGIFRRNEERKMGSLQLLLRQFFQPQFELGW